MAIQCKLNSFLLNTIDTKINAHLFISDHNELTGFYLLLSHIHSDSKSELQVYIPSENQNKIKLHVQQQATLTWGKSPSHAFA